MTTKQQALDAAIGKAKQHLDMLRTHLGSLSDQAKNNTVVADAVNLVNIEAESIETALTDASAAANKTA